MSDISKDVSLRFEQIQLILAEKRTSLSLMRTGIAVFTLPLSVLTVLIATSRYYNFFETALLLVPVLMVCVALFVLGGYLVHRSIRRIWHFEALIEKIKQSDPQFSKFFDDIES